MFHKFWKQTQKSRLIFFTLIIILSFLLVSCAAGGGTKKVVKISFIGPLTGGNAAMGLGGKNSFALAVDQHNKDPKSKYTYEPVYIDDEGKPDVGVQAALKAASDPAVVASARFGSIGCLNPSGTMR